jgi:hypothetical protein
MILLVTMTVVFFMSFMRFVILMGFVLRLTVILAFGSALITMLFRIVALVMPRPVGGRFRAAGMLLVISTH